LGDSQYLGNKRIWDISCRLDRFCRDGVSLLGSALGGVVRDFRNFGEHIFDFFPYKKIGNLNISVEKTRGEWEVQLLEKCSQPQ